MRILLAEDEIPLSNAIAAILKHSNFSVDAVYNGADAIDYIETGLYDAVVLDIMMPKVDGITVLRKIRSEGKKTPVIILTAKSETDDKVTGLDCGADDYLTKPFESKELLARIRAVTRRNTDATDNNLVFGDLCLCRNSFELSVGDNKVMLTAKEFQIMEMLMSGRGSIISAERIMDKVWGYESETEINVVWTYISYLRQKLKRLKSGVTVKAVRNIGYTLHIRG